MVKTEVMVQTLVFVASASKTEAMLRTLVFLASADFRENVVSAGVALFGPNQV